MSLDLKYVLVVLASGTTQQQLMDMQCDTRQLESLADKEDVFAVCVTCSGVAAYMTHCKLSAACYCDMPCSCSKDLLVIMSFCFVHCLLLNLLAALQALQRVDLQRQSSLLHAFTLCCIHTGLLENWMHAALHAVQHHSLPNCSFTKPHWLQNRCRHATIEQKSTLSWKVN